MKCQQSDAIIFSSIFSEEKNKLTYLLTVWVVTLINVHEMKHRMGKLRTNPVACPMTLIKLQRGVSMSCLHIAKSDTQHSDRHPILDSDFHLSLFVKYGKGGHRCCRRFHQSRMGYWLTEFDLARPISSIWSATSQLTSKLTEVVPAVKCTTLI